MGLHEELKITSPMGENREAMLSILRTSNLLMRAAGKFFTQFVVTEVQFNILMALKHGPEKGLSQQDLSHRLVVTKSNVVGLIDRLEKSGLVERRPHPEDRRYNQIVLTPEGRKIANTIQKEYEAVVNEMMSSLGKVEKKNLIDATEKIRSYLFLRWEGHHV